MVSLYLASRLVQLLPKGITVDKEMFLDMSPG